MPTSSEYQTSQDKLNAATNKLGTNQALMSAALDGASTRIAGVMDTLSTSMTAQEVADAKAVLDADTDKIDLVAANMLTNADVLNGLATTVTNPVPVPVPEPPVI